MNQSNDQSELNMMVRIAWLKIAWISTDCWMCFQTSSLSQLKTGKESFEKQLEEAQSKTAKYEQERNDAKSKVAKDKSSYELRISELQDKLSQV